MKNDVVKKEFRYAPEINGSYWLDESGNERKDCYRISEFDGKFKVFYFFQSWCPGCHKNGFPNLQKIYNAFSEDNQVQLLAIQTVFEGFNENSKDKLSVIQKTYGLKIPFGHDDGEGFGSKTMLNYNSGGTPWFVLIDQSGIIRFSDFNLDADKTIDFIKYELSRKNNRESKK